VGQAIRDLKAQLVSQETPAAEINQDPAVLSLLHELKCLKSQLGGDDPASDEAFFKRQREEREETKRREKILAESQRDSLKAAEQCLPRPLVQRKIYHAFRFAGSGSTFHYAPPARLNDAQTGFGNGHEPNPAVYITEKWDGTTMQATSRGIFQRLDSWGKRKEGKDPSDRYDVRLLAWREEDAGATSSQSRWEGLDFLDSDARHAEALKPYLHLFETLDEGLCVYFELLHTNINTTFKCLPSFSGIRVFDLSCSDRFLPFEETIDLAERIGLPLVGWEYRERLDADKLWAELAGAASRQYTTAAAPLEGFVIREAGRGERVAKARVEELLRGARTQVVAEPPLAATALLAQSCHFDTDGVDYLIRIGLPVMR